MRIAVNTRLLLPNKLEGIGWFTYENLKRITKDHPEHEFIFIFDRPYSEEFVFSDNVIPVVAKPQSRHPVLWYLFFEWGVPRILKKYKPDLFISPDGWLSLRTKTPSMAVIHDLNFENYPEYIPFIYRKYFQYFFPRFAKKAKRLCTVSEFTKKDIHNRYGIANEKIDVVYNGANEIYVPVPDDRKKEIRALYAQGAPYFLFIGLIHPRKNLARLITAFSTFRKETQSDTKLVIVGSKKWWTEEIKNAYDSSDHKDQIIFTGRIESSELKDVIASAFAMTYVSIFEGFGIPILEAMFCDVPVITSNTSSMPEVGGDAALYADPFSVRSIADQMILLFNDKALREKLISEGRNQRIKFSWQQTSEKLWKSIEACL